MNVVKHFDFLINIFYFSRIQPPTLPHCCDDKRHCPQLVNLHQTPRLSSDSQHSTTPSHCPPTPPHCCDNCQLKLSYR